MGSPWFGPLPNSQGGNTGSTPVCATMICGHLVAIFTELNLREAREACLGRYVFPGFGVTTRLSKSTRAEIISRVMCLDTENVPASAQPYTRS
jgi:hypothetical protein